MNYSEEYLFPEKFLSIEIQESINNHCYSNPIEKAIQKMENNEDRDHEERDPEILIFNYISDYLKLMFPDTLLNKTKEEQLNIIYEAITYFLEGRNRKDQIVRTLSVLRKNHKLENTKIQEKFLILCNKSLSKQRYKTLLFYKFKMLKFHIIVLWCQMNYADSARIKSILTNCWFSSTENIQEANIIIFDTCSVRQKSEDKITGKLKEIRPDQKVWITWCMIQHNLRNQ
jgi:hypothetical protein